MYLINRYNVCPLSIFQDVIYHNEAYTHSSSGDGSPEFEQHGVKYPDSQHRQQHLLPDPSQKSSKNNAPLSPQRGHSFIAAVISAIKNATGKADTLKSNASVAAAAAKEKKEICGHGMGTLFGFKISCFVIYSFYRIRFHRDVGFRD